MFKIFQEAKDQKICLSYLGVFNDEITTMLIGLAEINLENENYLNNLTSKVSFLIAECFQNVVRHRVFEDDIKVETEAVKEFFQIDVFDSIALTSANLIDNVYIESIEFKINQINSLDNNELKKLYREVLENGNLSSKGGAGLGLIEMVRKSGLPLKKKFLKYNEKYSLFFLGVEISKSKEKKNYKIDISKSVNFYNNLVNRNILLLYKGDFSTNSVIGLIEMLNNNIVNQKSSTSVKVKRIISNIEILQNISKHGKIIENKKEGIFTIQIIENEFHIECGNFIYLSKYEEFKKYLEEISILSISEINALYKNKLKTTQITEDGNCGLGLLDIARNSNNNYSYIFTETNEKEVFYSINVNLK